MGSFIIKAASSKKGGPECRYDASLAAKHEVQASLVIGKIYLKCRCYLKVH